MKHERIAIIVAIMMALSICVPTYAVDKNEKSLAEVNKNIKAKQSELKEQKEEVKTLEGQINSLEKEIKETQEDINELETAIDGAEEDLIELKADLKEAQEMVEQQNEDLSARLRSMYKNGSVGFVDVLLQSGDFSEFLTNLDLVQKIYESDKEVLKELQKSHDKIKKKKQEVEELKAELDTSKELAVEAKADLKDKKADVKEKKDAVNSDIAQTQEDIDALEAEAERLNEEIKKAQEAAAAKARAENKTTDYRGNGPMLWPAPQFTRISCHFGWRRHPITGRRNYHGGTDLAAPGGSPILAAESGTVIIAAYHYSYGNYVVIDHGGGIATLYAHSSKLLVRRGQEVNRGDKIALVGTTGSSTGNHLHFEVRKNGVRVDGLPYIQ